MTENKKSRWGQPEFFLVVLMLVSLIVIVGIIFMAGVHDEAAKDKEFYKYILDYRKSILTGVFSLFGAWVGAGAAYFFGRENMRENANTLLTLHKQSTGQDKLKEITVRDIPPKPLDKFINSKDTIENLLAYLQEHPENWFIPIEIGEKFEILNEDAVSRYLTTCYKGNEPYEESVKRKVNDIITFLDSDESLKKLKSVYVKANMNNNLKEVDEQLQKEGVYLAVVVNFAGRPTHFFTTSDLRQVLLKV